MPKDEDERAAILGRVLQAPEYLAHQQRYGASPFLAAIFVGITSLGAVSLASEGDLLLLVYWPLIVLTGVFTGLIVGLVSKVLRQFVLMIVVLMNLGGLLGCIIRLDVIAVVGAVVAAVVTYELTFALVCWLYLKREDPLIRSLLKQHLATCEPQA